MPDITINLAYFIALNEFLRSFDMFNEYLVGISIQYVRLSFGEIGRFPDSTDHPRSLPPLCTANKQVIIFETQLNQLLLSKFRMILKIFNRFD